MRYFFAIVFPPLAVLLCNRMGSFIVNCLLTLLFYFPGAIHAVLVVNDKIAEERQNKLIAAINRKNK